MSLRQESLSFTEHLERTERYMQTIRDAGDLPWFEDPERCAKVAAKVGLPADTPPLELRRALFARGRQ
jgi:hypothetical protein